MGLELSYTSYFRVFHLRHANQNDSNAARSGEARIAQDLLWDGQVHLNEQLRSDELL